MKDYILLDAEALYFPHSLEEDEIVVGVTNFALAGQSCPDIVKHGGKLYAFVTLEALSPHLVGELLTMFRYKLTTVQAEGKYVYDLDN